MLQSTGAAEKTVRQNCLDRVRVIKITMTRKRDLDRILSIMLKIGWRSGLNRFIRKQKATWMLFDK